MLIHCDHFGFVQYERGHSRKEWSEQLDGKLVVRPPFDHYLFLCASCSLFPRWNILRLRLLQFSIILCCSRCFEYVVQKWRKSSSPNNWPKPKRWYDTKNTHTKRNKTELTGMQIIINWREIIVVSESLKLYCRQCTLCACAFAWSEYETHIIVCHLNIMIVVRCVCHIFIKLFHTHTRAQQQREPKETRGTPKKQSTIFSKQWIDSMCRFSFVQFVMKCCYLKFIIQKKAAPAATTAETLLGRVVEF